MRRSLVMLVLVPVLVLLASTCSDDPAGEFLVESFDQATSTTLPPTTTTSAPSTTMAPATTTSLPPESGMCGDWIPVVTERGTHCVDPNALTTWEVQPTWFDAAPADAVMPAVVGADWRQLFVYDPSRPHDEQITPLRLAEGEPSNLRMTSDGAVVVEERFDDDDGEEYWPEVAIYRPDGTRDLVPGAVGLFDLVWLGGRQLAVVGVLEPIDGGLPVWLYDVDSLEWVAGSDLGFWSAEDHLLTHMDLSAGIAVATALFGTEDAISYRDLETGEPIIDLPDGATDVDIDAPETITAASLTPDATVVMWAWNPGDDYDGFLYTPGAWRIEAVDLESGATVLGWQVEWDNEPDDLRVMSTFHTGDFVIVNRSAGGAENRYPYPAYVIDLRGEEPQDWVADVAGIIVPINDWS